jgi:hypothetical protein
MLKRKISITLVRVVVIIFCITFQLFSGPLFNLIPHVFSRQEKTFDSFEKAFLVAELVSSYRTDGKVIAYVKTTNLCVIEIMNIKTKETTQIDQPIGEKRITHFFRNILVYDVVKSSSNIDIVVYSIDKKNTTVLTTEKGVQKEGVTNGKFVVWWDETNGGNLWSYQLDTNEKLKITHDDFPNFSDWFDETLNFGRVDGNDYKVSANDFVIYGITIAFNSELNCKMMKIVCFDLLYKKEVVLTKGTKSDFGFNPVIFWGTALYASLESHPQNSKPITYILYRYYVEQNIAIYEGKKIVYFTQKYASKNLPKGYFLPSFFQTGYEEEKQFCSFDGRVFGMYYDANQDTDILKFPKGDSTPCYFFGNETHYVGITAFGETKPLNNRIILYQLDSKAVRPVTPFQDDMHFSEQYLSFKNNILAWIDTQSLNRLFIRSLDDVILKSTKNRIGLAKNSSVKIPVTIQSKLFFSSSVTISCSIKFNPNGLSIISETEPIKLDGINEVVIEITVNSNSEIDEGLYTLLIECKGEDTLTTQKLSILLDIGNFSIRAEKIKDYCFFKEITRRKLYITNLSAAEQTYQIKVFSDYNHGGEGGLVPYYMEYSLSKEMITIPAHTEDYVDFILATKEDLDYREYQFSLEVTDSSKQILTQEIVAAYTPNFWFGYYRPFHLVSSEKKATFEIFFYTVSSYTGTLKFDLGSFISDRLSDYTFTPSTIILAPGDEKSVILTIPVVNFSQNYDYDITIYAEDTVTGEDIYFGGLTLKVDPSFIISYQKQKDNPGDPETTHHFEISIKSLLDQEREFSLQWDPSFDFNETYSYEFSKTNVTCPANKTITSILTIKNVPETDEWVNFALLVKDIKTGENYYEMLSLYLFDE